MLAVGDMSYIIVAVDDGSGCETDWVFVWNNEDGLKAVGMNVDVALCMVCIGERGESRAESWRVVLSGV